ncbi:MAG: FKBP-type peptidyl-prolyl cis-trans isomerase [Chitinophagia bacterium]
MKKIILLCALGFSTGFGFSQTKPTAAGKPTTTPPKATTAKKPATPAKPATPPKATIAAKPAASGAVVLKNAIDSMSYAIGMLDANFFKTQGITSLNPEALAKGFADALKGTTMCSPEQADQIVRMQMQRITKQKIEPTIKAGEKFLAENAKKPGVKTTSSGLQYEVITEGTGEKPVTSSTVKVHYEGFLINGFKFDSSRDRGEPTQFPLNGVIRGWTEGVALMPVGSRYKLYIPYQLGYGEQGSGEAIPGGSVLVFDVELLEIIK